MAVLTNTMLHGTSAVSDGDEAYQIEKSLRFNDGDTPLLHRHFDTGNRRKFTWSGWVKRCTLSTRQPFLIPYTANGEYTFYFGWDNSDVDHIQVGNYGTSWDFELISSAEFRDTSAWYHVVLAVNTSLASTHLQDRVQLWVNGNLQTWESGSQPSQNAEMYLGKAGQLDIGKLQASNVYLDQYIADYQFIDGLALTPAAFGKWDSANNWQPKAFALPQFNDGTNWSNLGGGVEESNYEWERCFTGFSDPADGLPNTSASSGNQITWVPDKDIIADHEILIPLWTSIPNGEIPDDDCLVINGENHGHRARNDMAHNTWKYYSVPGRKIDSTNGIILKNKSANNRYQLDHIIVDGIVLQDSITDVTTRHNINGGTKWSEYFTATSSWYSNSYLPQYAFDGKTGHGTLGHNGSETAHNSYAEFKPPTTITANDQIGLWMKLKNGNSASGEYDVKINGTSILSSLIAQGHGDWQYYTITSKTIDSTNGLYIGAEDSNHWCNLRGIVVDGHDLIDETCDNSFHLKFNDIKNDARLGRDSFNKGLEDSSVNGALPIYTTTADSDGYDDGSVNTGSSIRTDSVAGSGAISLAVPGTTTNDTHNSYPGAGSNLTATVNGAVVSTAESRFYGSSIYFDGSDDYITFPDSSGFSFGTGDFCMEGWFYALSFPNYARLFGQSTTGQTGNNAIGFFFDTSTHGHDLYMRYAPQDGAKVDTTMNYNAPKNKWFHFACTRNGTALRVFKDGTEVHRTTLASGFDFHNSSQPFGIGTASNDGEYWHGYIQDVRVYKGQAKYTSNFVCPTKNDFKVVNLKATDSSNGANIDCLRDSPTNGGTDTGAGGEVTGNYCTWDPRNKGSNVVLGNGNLTASLSSNGHQAVTGNVGMESGKYYWELKVSDWSNDGPIVGVYSDSHLITDQAGGTHSLGYRANGDIFVNGSTPVTGQTTYSSGDIISIALDLDNNNITWYKNNSQVYQYTSVTTAATSWRPSWKDYDSGSQCIANFGQRPFAYSAPAGYKAVCTANFPDLFSGDQLNNPSKYFDVVEWNGNNTSPRIIHIDGDFTPDMVWLKAKNWASRSYYVYDQIRTFASGKEIVPDGQWEMGSSGHATATAGWVDSVGASKFTLGAGNTSQGYTNQSSYKYVAWCWDAGTAAATVSDVGSLDPTDQWVNNTAGFSISQYTSTGSSDDTIGHGLNAKPDFIIIKNIDSGTKSWAVYHSALGAEYHLKLDTDGAVTDDAEYWHDTEPTNTVFSIGNWSAVNGTNNKHIAYCWTSIPGYSHAGKYTGNGSSNGSFVYLGFRPAYVIIKDSGSSRNWVVYDKSRVDSLYGNPVDNQLHPDGQFSESAGANYAIDFLSNGFKPIVDSASMNGSTHTYYYFAIAEHPFKTARAR